MKKLNFIFCFLISVILLSATACRPKGVLSTRQMEDIFVDLHTAEGIMQEAGYNYAHDEALRAYFLVILEQHGTTQAQFDSSLIWYTSNPTIFDKIYPKVINRLQAQADAYQLKLSQLEKKPNQSVQAWLNQCQHGLKWQLFQKKC